MRIVSLLPSATDIVCSLGLQECLVGRTHECDWPPGIEDVPVVTANRLPTGTMASREIEAAVGGRAHSGSSIYALDLEVLREASPDLILTQELCAVCAVSYREVTAAARVLEAGPTVVSLEPRTIGEIFDAVLLVGRLAGAEAAAEAVVGDGRERIRRVRAATAGRPPVRALCIEWLDPVYAAGHWVPEQVDAAGGRDELARRGEPSRVVSWDEVLACRPEAIFAMPCGFSLERSASEAGVLTRRPGWGKLPAVTEGRAWLVDGPAHFNRPGPRVVRGAEILAGLLHPGLVELEAGEAMPLPG